MFFLFISPDNASLGQIVGGQLQGHPVSGEDTDEILSQLSADMGQNPVSVLQFHLTHGIGQFLHNSSLFFDSLCF